MSHEGEAEAESLWQRAARRLGGRAAAPECARSHAGGQQDDQRDRGFLGQEREGEKDPQPQPERGAGRAPRQGEIHREQGEQRRQGVAASDQARHHFGLHRMQQE